MGQAGQEQGGQNRDDGDDHEQFNQRKRPRPQFIRVKF
jgi:hypothetical protein